MSESESDIEMQSSLPKKKVKLPKSPSANDPKKTTKAMIIEALTELKSRKGVSVQAIKKHLTLKYQIDTEKYNHLIKRSLKSGVEDGTFVQLKGIGASGSFKLANVKEKINKRKKKPTENGDKDTETGDKKKTVDEKKKTVDDKKKKADDKNKTEKKMLKANEEEKPWKGKGVGKSSQAKKIEIKEPKKAKEKETGEKEKKVQAKGKKPLMKRKSIGNIIKPPKMKPKKT